MSGADKFMKVPLIRPSMPGFNEYIDEISSIWDTRLLTNMATKHQQLESRLKEYLGVKNLQLFVNGHSALECILQAFELKGEVITTPFTFVSTVHAIVRCGLKPVFCDIRRDDFTIDASKIEELITDKTSAILPVHVYGMVCETDKIQNIASKYGLKVIYDAAHAFGVKVNGKGVGEYGDASMFSFHATKIYHTVEGGAAVFKDEILSDKLTAIKDFGLTGPETVDYIAGNSKLDEFRAAMGLCNLRHIDENIKLRERAALRYNERLSQMKDIQLLPQQKGIKNNYSYYPIVLHSKKISRDFLQAELLKRGIYTRKYFYPLCCNLSCYRSEYGSADVPDARYISDRVLCLPMFSEIKKEEVDYVCDAVQELL